MERPSRGSPTDPLRREPVSSASPFAFGKYELESGSLPGAREEILDAAEPFRALVGTALRAVLLGGLIPPGVCMLRAGL